MDAGREEDAKREFDRLAEQGFDALPVDHGWLSAMEWLAQLCAHFGDRDRARLLYDRLLPYADHFITTYSYFTPSGVAHRPLALLAATLGEHERACEHFEAALDPSRLTGTPYALAQCRHDYAVVLLARGGPDNRERARTLIAEATEMARTFEMTHLQRQLTQLTAGGSAAVPRRQTPVRQRAKDAASDVKAAVTVRGRAALARVLEGATDSELEQRFSSPVAQRALFAGMARGYQPRLAYGFQGEIGFELTYDTASAGEPGERPPDWWTVRVERRRAYAERRLPRDPAVTLHADVPTFVRLACGLESPMHAAAFDRAHAEGDILLGMRLSEMFGAVNPADLLPDDYRAAASS